MVESSLLFLSGLGAALLLGALLIPWLRKLKIGQQIRSDGPKSHQSKAGTPTMGGLIFIMSAIVAWAIYRLLTGTGVTVEEVMIMGFPALYAAVGFIDDFRKVRRGRSLGLRAREKMALQILFAALFVYAAESMGRGTYLILPWSRATIDLGALYGVFGVLVIVSAGNAVNLTDGLDGLAAGTVLIALGAYYVIGRAAGSALGLFGICGPVAVWGGAILGFLAYNRHPAKVFMGDTGSNALGALLASIAILTRTEVVLIFIAGIPVIETLSDIVQVASFQLLGKRVFKMAPIHHHFELSGWPETKIVAVFWVAQAIFALLGIASMAMVP